LFFESSKN
ncbi:hypothetical protein D030_1711B, partial [Vibrio parahaemolyticus AQ3810]